MNICYIISAGETDKIKIEKDMTDYIICADAGYKKAIENSIAPDLVVGDFDSLGEVPKNENIKVHPSEKDETDTFLAINCGIERGYKSFVIFGALGGRLDHTFANIQLLKYLAEHGMKCTLHSPRETVTVLKDSSLVFSENERGVISVFSLSDSSEGVTETGLKYCLENAVLTSSFPLGVSNEFIGKESVISVKSGVLMIVRERGV